MYDVCWVVNGKLQDNRLLYRVERVLQWMREQIHVR